MRNVIQWDLNVFFSKNLQKSPSGWGLCPQTPIAIGGWGLCPQTPVSDTFEYTSLLNTSSKLDFYTFQQLVFALSLYQNLGKVPSSYGFRSSILRYLCPTKNYFFENFWWRHCVWFVVWAPPIKNPGCAYGPAFMTSFVPFKNAGSWHAFFAVNFHQSLNFTKNFKLIHCSVLELNIFLRLQQNFLQQWAICCFCKPRFFLTRKKTCTCFQRQGT